MEETAIEVIFGIRIINSSMLDLTQDCETETEVVV